MSGQSGLQVNLRDSLAPLSANVAHYIAKLRDAGFSCSHVRQDWIEEHCSAADKSAHARYLLEYIGEALSADKPAEILFTDSQDCHSAWLRAAKETRLKSHGAVAQLLAQRATRHLVELSPCLREQARITESALPRDREQMDAWTQTFVARRAEELLAHSEAIASSRSRLPVARNEVSLQAFFAAEVLAAFEALGARSVPTLRRNQALQRDEQIVAVVFEVADDCLFVLLPSVVSSAPAKSKAFEGTLGIGFRLMTPAALAAPKFEFGRDTVLHLHELLPNKFNGYGRFDKPEEFCLNILAWTAALRILLPDVLQTLRAAATVPAPSQLH